MILRVAVFVDWHNEDNDNMFVITKDSTSCKGSQSIIYSDSAIIDKPDLFGYKQISNIEKV